MADYVRHDIFWQERAWPAEGQPKISEHTPLSLHLRLESGGGSESDKSSKKRARDEE